MIWIKINETTKIMVWKAYVFASTKESDNCFKMSLISNNGSHVSHWRSRFDSHKDIKEQAEIMIEFNNFN